jgi:hypothetical protein
MVLVVFILLGWEGGVWRYFWVLSPPFLLVDISGDFVVIFGRLK